MKVILAPTAELAQQIVSAYDGDINCVEAEYGAVEVRGLLNNLAHHGPRSGNDAPCIAETKPNEADCLVSHLDLDTIGGILRCQGDPLTPHAWFWWGAAVIDVQGPQHLHELRQDNIDCLNAYWAWSSQLPRTRYTEIVDVTDLYEQAVTVLREIIAPFSTFPAPATEEQVAKQKARLEEGRAWAAEQLAATQACLVSECAHVRYFETEQTFCNSSYMSPELGLIPAIVSFNKAKGSITLSFYDDSCGDAVAIMQRVFGPEAGGRRGIAGTPRNGIYTREDALRLVNELK